MNKEINKNIDWIEEIFEKMEKQRDELQDYQINDPVKKEIITKIMKRLNKLEKNEKEEKEQQNIRNNKMEKKEK